MRIAHLRCFDRKKTWYWDRPDMGSGGFNQMCYGNVNDGNDVAVSYTYSNGDGVGLSGDR